MKNNTINNNDDVIDSRDVIARIKELEDDRREFIDNIEEMESEGPRDAAKIEEEKENLAQWDEENGEELTLLRKLAEEGESIDDWEYGTSLIRESYFIDYCRELVQDIGDLPRNIPSYLEIDWEKTANNLRIDYTEIEFGDVTYLVR